MKKLSIVGRGTVGSLSIAHFLKYTDWEIDWVYDPDTPTTAVGEGTTLQTPKALYNTLGWLASDLYELGGTVKQGIYKQNWGQGDTYLHAFPIDQVGIHMSAIDLQNKIYNDLKNNNRVNYVEKRVDNPYELDSDFVLMCVGSPTKLTQNEFNLDRKIYLNSAYVTQCYWDYPQFTHTLTIARPWGWVFGIPLQKRCSIGYMYNDAYADIETIKNDVKNVFKEFNLKPSEKTNSLKFNSYSRINNFDNKVVYNGNGSFFLEPLEATSTTTADRVQRLAYDVWFNNKTAAEAQEIYNEEIENVEGMINLHYMAGSIFNNKFWDFAQNSAEKHIEGLAKNNSLFTSFVNNCLKDTVDDNLTVGTWQKRSYNYNIKKLSIENKLSNIINKYMHE